MTASAETIVARVTELQPRWLTIDGAAAYCSLSSKSLRRLISSGRLQPHRPVRGRLLIDVRELDSYIAGATSTPRTGRGRA